MPTNPTIPQSRVRRTALTAAWSAAIDARNALKPELDDVTHLVRWIAYTKARDEYLRLRFGGSR